MNTASTALTRDAHIELPIICGAMYPCSNPELVGAVSAAGGIGIVQPISLTYVHGHEFREGLRLITSLADGRPIGMNALIESSSRNYHERMVRWVDIALEEGVRFFVTSLGNPRWVAEKVHAAGGAVYHDVTELKWARKGADAGVDGLIAVNCRAGGHAGSRSEEQLMDELRPVGLPVVCAGGISTAEDIARVMGLGYSGVQMGTRFIATTECSAHERYKQAIVNADARDIVLTERLTGVPVAVINTPYVQRIGLHASPLGRWLLRQPRTKRLMRSWYGVRSFMRLKRSHAAGDLSRDYWQAGQSVEGVTRIESVRSLMQDFAVATNNPPTPSR